MKRITLVLSVLVLAMLLAGCGSNEDDGKINLPISSRDLKNTNYQDVVAKFENAGFTNVQTVIIDDLVLGWFTKDGEVEEVSVDGYTTFTTDSRYPADVEIVVSYHTFPADEEEEVAESSTPIPTVEAEPTEIAQSTEGPQPTEEKQPTEEPQSSVEEEIITIDNNEEFAAVLATKDPGDQIIEDFAMKYEGRIIEFDGNIGYMDYHGDYTTRYDFLIFAWDYSETSISGPYFKFEDCNTTYDLHWTGDNIPDTVGIGDNLHFVARILYYNDTQELFFLEPISTEGR
jgi:hypothetical protein